jgi:polar amino acid transport system substrate-binding protein
VGEDTTTTAQDTTTTAGDTTTTAEETTTSVDDMALPDLEGITVTVGVENAYLPFNYIPLGETEGTGWDYEAWAAICELLNCVPEFVEAGWPAVIDQVAEGDLDTAADGISITDERKEVVDFSDPYMTVTQKLIVQLDDDRYATAQDLIDDTEAIIATQIGTTNYELALELVGESRIQAFDQFGLAIQALIAGDVDAVIIDDAAGLGYIGENAESIKTIDDPLQSDPLGFIFPLGSELVDPVNQAIAELADDGTLQELGVKYFGPDFDIGYEDIEEVG